jgi:tetratricopeptide (TPR) repeat protein
MVALSARAHQPADAGRWAELALSTAADATSVRESVALAFHAEGDDASALRYIRDAVTAPSASLDAKIVYVEIAPASERAAAMARLQSTDIAGEADADALGRAGAALAVAGLYPDAIRFLERAADLDRASAARWVQLGYAQLSAARLADARSSLTEAARLDPQDPTAAAGLAAANCAMGLRDEALRVALVALAIDPREPTALRVVEACRSRTFS